MTLVCFRDWWRIGKMISQSKSSKAVYRQNRIWRSVHYYRTMVSRTEGEPMGSARVAVLRHLDRSLARAASKDATDAWLLERFVRARDQDAFEQLVRRRSVA